MGYSRQCQWSLVSILHSIIAYIGSQYVYSYINAISESGSKEKPPGFRGGVIADPMGLGKTLTMIALAATDLTRSTNFTDMADVPFRDSRSVSATLIVVPPPRRSRVPAPYYTNQASSTSMGKPNLRVCG